MRSTKRQLQWFLSHLGVYQRLKGSRLYDWYWWLANERIIHARDRELAFYKALLAGLKKGGLIFDVGANQGSKTDIFLRLGARVVAIDPDEANQTILRQRFIKHRLTPNPVTIVCKAVSDHSSIETMWIDSPGSAKNTLSHKWVSTLRADDRRFGRSVVFGDLREVEATTLDDLIRHYGVPLFIKIDVEGFEPMVLRGLHCSVPFISFEVNLPEFRPEGLECVDLLQQLNHSGLFNYVANVEDGFVLCGWLAAQNFAQVLNSCTESSIEVFWTTATVSASDSDASEI